MDGLVHHRIQQFIDHLQISNNQFAKEIGDSSAKISQVTNDRGERPDFRISLVMKILQRYPQMNADWLLTGEGGMFKGKESASIAQQAKFDGEPRQPIAGWRLRLLEAQEAKQTIPLVEQKAYASYLAGHTDTEYMDSRPVIYYPELKGMGPVIAIRVQGESMAPTICPDDVLLCTYVEPSTKLKENEVYVVCHTEGVVVKRVLLHPEKRQAYICKSDNPEYPAFEVGLDQVQHLWRVRRRITAFLDFSDAATERLQAFEHKLNQLQERLPS